MPLSSEETIIVQYLIMEDEGLELLPYFDCCGKFFRKCICKIQGKLTIGVGRNIEDVGLSENEAIGLELNDIKRVTLEIERKYPWFITLNSARKVVITSMVFNLGLSAFSEFKKMILCIESGDYASASGEMLKSQWASQVKDRSERLSRIFKQGTF